MTTMFNRLIDRDGVSPLPSIMIIIMIMVIIEGPYLQVDGVSPLPTIIIMIMITIIII